MHMHSSNRRQILPHLMRMLAVAAVAAFGVAFLSGRVSDPPEARAVTVTVQYDPTDPKGVDPCAPNPPMLVCAGGVDQTPQAVAIVQAAADFWMGVVKDPHNMTILVSWLDPEDSQLPEAHVEMKDMQGRVTLGRVRLVPNVFTYFYDPTPDSDEEFLARSTDTCQVLGSGMMRPKLYRTLLPAEKAEAFANQASEIVEVGINGLARKSSCDGVTPIGEDLYMEALHEVGHLMGLVPPTGTCNDGNLASGLVPPASMTGGATVAIRPYRYMKDGVEKIDCNHLAAGGISQCKPAPGDQSTTSPEESAIAGMSIHECTAHQALMWQGKYPGGRTLPSVVDILAIATAKGWETVDLPRKYSLHGGGAWNAAGTWFGNRAPDSGDDVYVVNQQADNQFVTVTSSANASARNLFISDENKVRVTGSKLTIGRTAWVAGPDSQEGPVRPIVERNIGQELGVTPVPTTLEVGSGGTVVGDRLGVEPGARLRLQSNGQAQFGDVINSGSIEGRGTLGITRSFSNGTNDPEHLSGTIRAEDGTLRIVTPAGGGLAAQTPEVDLDGPSPASSPTAPRLLALDGNIEIDAIVEQTMWVDMRIGAGHTLRFSRNGIIQGGSGLEKFALRFEGGATGATFDAPPSEFRGIVTADGIGAFTGETMFGNTASVRLDLGGTTAGTQHDQLRFKEEVEFNGTLKVSPKNGFTPKSGDSFTLATYKSHTGQFVAVDLPPAPALNLTWELQYNATSLRLVLKEKGLAQPSPSPSASPTPRPTATPRPTPMPTLTPGGPGASISPSPSATPRPR